MDSSKKFNITNPESDLLTITPLGAGQEVGRSCHILEFKGKKIMLDCGIHPGYNGLLSLPYIDDIDTSDIDILLISHFHLDHCGALPWLLSKTTFKGRVFMTHATKAIYRWLLSDYIKISNFSADDMLFTEKDLEASMDIIETIHFHQQREVSGIRISCYHAGHVLGAAMFLIEISGVKVLYTGDFSRQEDRHLMSAEIPKVHPDVLIMESTYGTHIHDKREQREARFASTVQNIVTRGGRCLIPVFALGRAQELLLILDEYWESHSDLWDIPIYYASALAKKCMLVYQTYVSAMNDRMKRQMSISNPFQFKHISSLKNMADFNDIGPCVILASPGMMQNGLSRELFENWASDRRNGVIIAGYAIEGTLAKELLTEPDEVVSMSGQTIQRKCSIDYISFSAHADYTQVNEFVQQVKPKNIVLVHGEHNEMNRLKLALTKDLESVGIAKLPIYNPKNCTTVEFHFKGERDAKIIGRLAVNEFNEGDIIRGLIFRRGFSYHILHQEDVKDYTHISTTKIKQKLWVKFNSSQFYELFQKLKIIFNTCEIVYKESDNNDPEQIFIMNGIIILFFDVSLKSIYIEWDSDLTVDGFVDSIISVILRLEQSWNNNESRTDVIEDAKNEHHDLNSNDSLLFLLKDIFGEESVSMIEDACGISNQLIKVNSSKSELLINPLTLSINSNDEKFKNYVWSILRYYASATSPFCQCK